MTKNKHKKHIQLLVSVLGGSLSVLALSVLWSFQVIEFPSEVVYFARYLKINLSSYNQTASQLQVLFHKQEHSLSCEAATLKMILNYHDIDVSESEVINKIPVDSTPRLGDVWGDPNIGFVGNIDGKMLVDGYGVYWGPLAIAASHWRGSKIVKNGLTSDLVEHVSAGRPIIVWGYLGRGQSATWKTPEGETVRAVNGEHTRIVYGFKGSPENPDGFFVMDPIYGPEYWEKSKFMRNWDAFGRMGVVVYP